MLLYSMNMLMGKSINMPRYDQKIKLTKNGISPDVAASVPMIHVHGPIAAIHPNKKGLMYPCPVIYFLFMSSTTSPNRFIHAFSKKMHNNVHTSRIPASAAITQIMMLLESAYSIHLYALGPRLSELVPVPAL